MAGVGRPAEARGRRRGAGRRGARSLALALGAAAALGLRGWSCSCQGAWSAPGGRRSTLLGTLGLGVGIAKPGLASAETVSDSVAPWRKEIPETLQILRELQGKWPEIEQQGSIGGGRVRRVLDYTLVENISISVAKGEPVGANFRNRRVTSVTRPELGWREKDQVVAVNGVPITSPEAMKSRMKEAQDAGKVLRLAVARKKQSPIDGIEEDLVEAYMALDGRDLPDLDEVVSHLNAARVMATGASGSGRASGEMMEELRLEIDALVPDLTRIVKAMG